MTLDAYARPKPTSLNLADRKEVIIHLLSEFDSFECAKALAHRGMHTCSRDFSSLTRPLGLAWGGLPVGHWL